MEFDFSRYSKIVANDLSLNGSISSALGGLSQWSSSSSDIYYNDGNVGIGTTSPVGKMQIQYDQSALPTGQNTGSLDGTLILTNNHVNTAGSYGANIKFASRWSSGDITTQRDPLEFGAIAGYGGYNGGFGGGLTFWTHPNSNDPMEERMRITDDGNIGIGTTSPGAKLHIKDGPICVERTFDPGNDNGEAGLVFKEIGYDNCFYMAYDAGGTAGTDNEHLTFYNSGSSGANPTADEGNPIMRLNGNGYVSIGTTSVITNQKFLVFYETTNNDSTTFRVGKSGVMVIARGIYDNVDTYNGGRIYTNYDNYRPNLNWQLSTNERFGFQMWTSSSFYATYQGNHIGYFATNGTGSSRINFTGQHRNLIKDIPAKQASTYKGLIVCADNNEYISIENDKQVKTGKNAITINDALPFVSLCKKEQDKKCYGVISDAEDENDGKREYDSGIFVSIYAKTLGDNRFYINSVGEGAIWVSNKNGSIESGDYITTSSIPGYGQKQNDDILHNYTVAKITMDCDFNPVLKYKKIVKQNIIPFFQDISGDYWQDSSGIVYHNPGANYFEDSDGKRIFYTEEGEPIYDFSFKDINMFEKSLFDQCGNLIQYIDINYYHSETKELLYGHKLESADDRNYSLPYTNMIFNNPKYNVNLDASRNVISVTENILNEHGEIQWEDTTEQEYAYEIRHLDPSGNIITKEQHDSTISDGGSAYIAAFVGCTYHCG
jgi:hypothetical protein